MYSAILSVLLMGMFPFLEQNGASAPLIVPPQVAPPAPLEEQIPGSSFRAVSASGIVVLDLQSGQQLFGRNPELRRPMGSLTKLMTALLIVENHSLDEVVTVPEGLTRSAGSKAYVSPGEKYTAGDLLSALLIASANDAAQSLAVHHSGSERLFVQEMNARTKALGLTETSFANASGLDETRQWSTSRDIALLASYVLHQPAIRERLSTRDMTIKDSAGRTITLTHTHELLHGSNTVIAGKTGTTSAAGQCLLSIIREGEREYAVVLLGSRSRYIDMKRILEALGKLFA